LNSIDDDDMTGTIAVNSDRLNADDLLIEPIDVTITAVTKIAGNGRGEKAKIAIPPHMPYIPAKGMCVGLILCFGKKRSGWIGKKIRLFRNPDVIYAGKAAGGIQISHAEISAPVTFMMAISRHVKVPFTILPFPADDEGPDILALKSRAKDAAMGGVENLKTWWLGLEREEKKILNPHWPEFEKLAQEAENG